MKIAAAIGAYALAAVLALVLFMDPFEPGQREVAASPGEFIHPISVQDGSASAPVSIVEFVSWTCPHCRAFEREAQPFLGPLIAAGKVRVIYAPYPRDTKAQLIWMWVSCVPPEKRPALAHFLLRADLSKPARQVVWSGLEKAALSGEEKARIVTCAGSDQTLAALRASVAKAEKRLGVAHTPTFLIDRVVYVGKLSQRKFQAVVKKALAASKRQGPDVPIASN